MTRAPSNSSQQLDCNPATMFHLKNNQQHAFPAVPPSNSAGDHEMQDYYADSSAPRPSPNQTPYLTPYLGLRARLSQVWINRWTVLLLLVLVRVMLAIASTGDGLQSARREALSACTNVEKIGSTMASMPHYMSQGINKLTARGIERAVGGLQSMVTMSISGVEEILVFVIGMMTNTYLCLITLVVSGSTRAAVDLLIRAQDDLNKVLGDIGNDIGGAVKGIQDTIDGFTNKVNTVFGGSPPKVDFTKQIDALKNVKVSPKIADDLKRLNSSIPTFDDVKNATETVLRFPFTELKKTIAKSWTKYTFNDSVFPVPQKEKLNFCSSSNGINDFFDGLDDLARTLKRVFLGTLLTAAILACVPMAWWEIKRYRRLQQRAKDINKHAYDPMDAIYISSRPYTADFGRWVARRFSSPRRQVIARWAVSYFTSVPALFILSLAAAGLFACLCQYIILKAIEKQVPELTGQVANFTAKVVTQLNNASNQWADGTNKAIVAESARLNEDLFGWVDVSSTAVNNTLNKFVEETIKVLDKTFAGTPLGDPVKEVFNCLIGIKIAGLQRGITWIHDNAKISFPLLSNDTFSLGAIAKMTSGSGDDELLSDPSGKAKDEISNAILKVTSGIRKAIREEALISTFILVCYLLVFFIALGYAMWKLSGTEKVRGDAGHEYDHDQYPTERVQYNGTGPQEAAVPAPRPMSPAPAYQPSVNPDVTATGYGLNPHPLPRRSEDTITEEKYPQASSSNWPFHREPERTQYKNEKSSGFI